LSAIPYLEEALIPAYPLRPNHNYVPLLYYSRTLITLIRDVIYNIP